MSERSAAFVKGGCGCLAAFAAIGALALLAGGRVTVNCGGLAILFVIGGGIGLIGFAVYKKGVRAGQGVAPPLSPPAAPRPWTCLACATDNAPEAGICRNCREPR